MKKWLIVTALFGGMLVKAQTPVLTLPKDSIELGEPLEVSLRLTLAQGTDYTWALWPDTLSGIEILDLGTLDTLSQDSDSLVLNQTATLTSYDSAWVEIPALAVRVAGDPRYSLPQMLYVRFPEVAADAEYYDIKAPQEIPLNYWLIAAYIAAALLLIALIIWAVQRYKNRPPKTQKAPEVYIPPVEWALQALDELAQKELWQKGAVKQYYSELVDILRHFIQKEFGQKTMECTAEELVQKLQSLERDRENLAQLTGTLRLSTMVKYARQAPLAGENEQAFASVKQFVLKQKPSEDDAGNA